MANGFSYFDYIRITEDVPELYKILEKWKIQKEEYRSEWLGDYPGSPGRWPAKLVETSFIYKETPYRIFPDDIGLERGNCWDEGFMEYLQSKIEQDLRAIGATDIVSLGFID